MSVAIERTLARIRLLPPNEEQWAVSLFRLHFASKQLQHHRIHTHFESHPSPVRVGMSGAQVACVARRGALLIVVIVARAAAASNAQPTVAVVDALSTPPSARLVALTASAQAAALAPIAGADAIFDLVALPDVGATRDQRFVPMLARFASGAVALVAVPSRARDSATAKPMVAPFVVLLRAPELALPESGSCVPMVVAPLPVAASAGFAAARVFLGTAPPPDGEDDAAAAVRLFTFTVTWRPDDPIGADLRSSSPVSRVRCAAPWSPALLPFRISLCCADTAPSVASLSVTRAFASFNLLVEGRVRLGDAASGTQQALFVRTASVAAAAAADAPTTPAGEGDDSATFEVRPGGFVLCASPQRHDDVSTAASDTASYVSPASGTLAWLDGADDDEHSLSTSSPPAALLLQGLGFVVASDVAVTGVAAQVAHVVAALEIGRGGAASVRVFVAAASARGGATPQELAVLPLPDQLRRGAATLDEAGARLLPLMLLHCQPCDGGVPAPGAAPPALVAVALYEDLSCVAVRVALRPVPSAALALGAGGPTVYADTQIWQLAGSVLDAVRAPERSLWRQARCLLASPVPLDKTSGGITLIVPLDGGRGARFSVSAWSLPAADASSVTVPRARCDVVQPDCDTVAIAVAAKPASPASVLERVLVSGGDGGDSAVGSAAAHHEVRLHSYELTAQIWRQEAAKRKWRRRRRVCIGGSRAAHRAHEAVVRRHPHCVGASRAERPGPRQRSRR